MARRPAGGGASLARRGAMLQENDRGSPPADAPTAPAVAPLTSSEQAKAANAKDEKQRKSEDALADWAALVQEMVDPNAAAPNVIHGQQRPLFLLSRPQVARATGSWTSSVLEVCPCFSIEHAHHSHGPAVQS